MGVDVLCAPVVDGRINIVGVTDAAVPASAGGGSGGVGSARGCSAAWASRRTASTRASTSPLPAPGSPSATTSAPSRVTWQAEGDAVAVGQIVAVLEGVLRRNPNHTGANHYYIHAVEASPEPQRGLPCAKRLPSLMPGAGHLVHMPAHIYMRVGLYREASERNAKAATVDREYLLHHPLEGNYASGYYAHNLHFLNASLVMEGRSAEALQVARDLLSKISVSEIVKEPSLNSGRKARPIAANEPSARHQSSIEPSWLPQAPATR